MRCPEPGKLSASVSLLIRWILLRDLSVHPAVPPCYRLANTPQQRAPAKKESHSLLLTVGWLFTVKLFPLPVKPDKSCHMQFLCIMEMFCWCFKFSFHRCDPAMDCESAMQQLRPSHGWSRRSSTEGKEQSWPLLLLVLLPLKDPVVLLLSFSLSWFSKSMFRDLQGTKQRWQMSSKLLLRLISCSPTATAPCPCKSPVMLITGNNTTHSGKLK